MACTGNCSKIYYLFVVTGEWNVRDANRDITDKLNETTKSFIGKEVAAAYETLGAEGKLVGDGCAKGCECKCVKPTWNRKEVRDAEAAKKAGTGTDDTIEQTIKMATPPGTTPPYTLIIHFKGYGAKTVTGQCK